MTQAPIRNHLLATRSAIVRGFVTPLVGRLSDHLRTWNRPFITVENAEIQDLVDGETRTAAVTLVQLESLIWAHEFVALAGDDHLRRQYEPEDEAAVRLVLREPAGLSIEGITTASSLAHMSRFLALQRLRGTAAAPEAQKHADAMAGLSYILVKRGAPAIIQVL